MTDDSHDAVAESFERALELEGAARTDYLAELDGRAPDLAARVRALLAADAAAGASRLDRPALAPTEPPRSIGGLTVLGVLGRGGMGIVYEAEQERPRRRVAIKVLRDEVATDSLRRRFELEGELLARLEHPGIARVYSVGADAGRPYLVMEKIDGSPIDSWADGRRLDQRARVELLARVAEAVAHAHERGVVHRDLKPANVLVTDAGQPVVLDFGIARALDADVNADSLRTRAGELWGTVATMAPEQAAGHSAAVGTPADVYALGVLGYRLTTGRFPHEVEGRPLAEALRVVAETPVPRPSSVAAAVRGDLETVLLHAAQAEPERRYASAAEFARDLRRVLDDEPITARPPSARYQLVKFARRHRAWVAGLGIAAAALLIGSVTSTLLFLESRDRGRRLAVAADEAREAQAAAEARNAELVAAEAFFDATLRAASPLEDGADVRVVDALERGAERIDDYATSPLARARLMSRIGATLAALDRREVAARVWGDALAIDHKDDSLADELRAQLAQLVWERDQSPDAMAEFEAAVARDRARGVDATADGVDRQRSIVAALTSVGRVDDARTQLERAIAASAALGPLDVARTELIGVQLDIAAGDMARAEARARQAIETLRELVGPDALETVRAEQTLAVALYYIGGHDEAVALSRHALEVLEALTDGDHAELLGPLELLCVIELERNDLEAAGAAIDRAVGIAERLFAADSITVASLLVQRAGVAEYSGDTDGAFVDYERSIAILEGDEPTLTLASALASAGALHLREWRPSEAVPFLRRSAEVHEPLTGPLDLRLGWTLRALGQALGKAGDLEAALDAHRRSLAVAREHAASTGPFDLIERGVSVGETLIDLDRDGEARAVLDGVRSAVEEFGDPRLAAVFDLQDGTLLARSGRVDEGAALIEPAAQVLARDGEYAPRAARRLEQLARLAEQR